MKKRSDGRYVKKVTLPDGQQKYIYGKSQPEVTQKVRSLWQTYETGIKLYDQTTVGQWAEQWFSTYKQALRYSTRAGYSNAYNTHIMPYLATIPLKEVRPVQIQHVMNQLSGKSEALQQKVLSTLRQLFETARLNHLMTDDPTKGIKITRHTSREKQKFLSLNQQEELIRLVTEPRAKAFCALCMYTGLRREEALGLMWTDLSQGCLTVRRAVTFQKNQQDPDHSLKSKAANRVIPVPSLLRQILAETPKSGLYIITNTNGSEMTLTAFRRMWAKVTAAVDYPIHPHMLRHTYATILHRAGVSLKDAQYLMGHADIKMTANIYTHIEKEQVLYTATQIEAYLKQGGQNGGQSLTFGV